eukprot:CAMPEP_0113823906 /NCGR_PEP_ID=MMETSP0328-20130328/2976_1 /TAXON_ID=39455 /ORGANISM="Alexandrium minutum" /LENGTH=109 /DNA_ID=CAMNT_0000791845 /DNA_START=91 /DNA_END=420 /DNA_ORIENTATION=+ /assembly_acc=CAM_ASM_000350
MTAHMRHSGTKVCPNGTPNASPSPAECNVLAEELAVLGNHGVEEAPPHVVVRCTASVGAADAALQVRVRLLQHLEDAAPDQHAACRASVDFDHSAAPVESLLNLFWMGM